MPNKNKNGAGVVVFRNIEGNDEVLILLKKNGTFDIPKGHCDNSDLDKFSTAQRECFEETQIFIAPSDILTDDFYEDRGMTIFCAQTNQDPVIEKNPVSGKLEHINFYWVNPHTAIKILPAYLSDAVLWSLKYIDNT